MDYGDFSESEIYDLLEGKLDSEAQQEGSTSTGPPKKKPQFAIVGDKLISGPDFNVTKYVMEEFPDASVLPTDWVKINHESGLPIYFHKRTRVATLSKPFCVGKYPARMRHIPLASIPCLKRKKDLESVKNSTEKNEAVSFDHRNLQHSEVREYCQELFKIRQLSIARWTSWKNRRQYEKLLHRVNKDGDNPELSNVKIVGETSTCKVVESTTDAAVDAEEQPQRVQKTDTEKKEDDLDTNAQSNMQDQEQETVNETNGGASGLVTQGGSTYIHIGQSAMKQGNSKGRKQYLRVDGKPANAVLNEFTVLSTGDYPVYEDVQLPACEKSGEFCCVVKISGIIYGIGRGRNKKLAKLEAAQEALRALIPGWKTLGDQSNNQQKQQNEQERDPMLQSVSVFENVPVDNPNITEMCQKLGLSTPYKILQTCLLRNFGIGDTELSCSVEQISAEEMAAPNKPGQHQHHQYKMDKMVKLTVGERSAEVRAFSQKQGKHQAAQALLKQMHPHINNWASILRLYLRGPDVNLTATAALQRDTAVHEMAVQKKSSSEILVKLREEMRKLANQLESENNTSEQDSNTASAT